MNASYFCPCYWSILSETSILFDLPRPIKPQTTLVNDLCSHKNVNGRQRPATNKKPKKRKCMQIFLIKGCCGWGWQADLESVCAI